MGRGPDLLLGLPRQRYAGDAAAWGNAELRLALVRARVLVPTDFGVFGLADGGRVFLDGETSRAWHTGFGGGLWASFLKPENTVTLAAARSEGSLRVSLTGGFRF